MHDYDEALTEQILAGRAADVHGGFFLTHLRTGMDVLDCGCGPAINYRWIGRSRQIEDRHGVYSKTSHVLICGRILPHFLESKMQ